MGFKKTREQSGLTQKQVADALGVTQSAVSLWETGQSLPRAEMLIKIAKLYGCSISDLLN